MGLVYVIQTEIFCYEIDENVFCFTSLRFNSCDCKLVTLPKS